MKNTFLITLMIAISLTSFSQEGKWKKTIKTNTLESYQKFIEKYPDSEYYQSGMDRIMTIELEEAKTLNTINAYSKFEKKYPSTSYSEEAKILLATLEYKNAIQINSVSSYTNFIQKFPKSTLSAKAKIKLINLEYKQAYEEYTLESFQSFIIKYPKSDYLDKINSEIEIITEYKKNIALNDENEYRLFLQRFPETRFKNEIEQILLENRVLNGTPSVQDALVYFSVHPEGSKSVFIWEKFRNSYYMNNKIFNEKSKNIIQDIIISKFSTEYEKFKSYLNYYDTHGTDTRYQEKAMRNFSEAFRDLMLIVNERPIIEQNYDAINMMGMLMDEISDQYINGNMYQRISAAFGKSIMTILVLSNDNEEVIGYPFYGREDEWDSNDSSIVMFKNECLDMLEQNINSATAKDLKGVMSAYVQKEKNDSLKERLKVLIAKAEGLINE